AIYFYSFRNISYGKRERQTPSNSLFHKERGYGFEDDLQVQPGRPVFDVVNIELHHLLEREAIAAADLGQAGQSRLYVAPFAVPGFVAFNLVWDGRSRADQRHLALEDVEELREFVDAQAAKEGADAREPAAVDEFVAGLLVRAEVGIALAFDDARHVIA